ncbi:DUF397 domain-containing protein [Couchioplanes caeruleus]|uniref:DUF397 domain-containing protein n=1 Tax=Couchioplanes caeruleus TaxID=56438 RepID=UPI0020C0DAD6|nr:DUF397 domain-containing protein [Couchioplanes caeruleus]UQU64197.1 DUF397 domain-containing protein [Couchioplanes caeruleus]
MIPANFDRHNLAWRIAKKSANGNCVEVAKYDNLIAVRNSRYPEGDVILYTIPEFDAFLDGAKKGEFDDLVS